MKDRGREREESQDVPTKLSKLTRRGEGKKGFLRSRGGLVRSEGAKTRGAASALETRYVTCDLRRATHRYTLSYVDFADTYT